MADIRKIAIGKIRRRPDARERVDKALAELEQSIAANGLLQPIVVRRLGAGEFEIVAGAHRAQACDLLGWTEIPAMVLDLDDLHAEMAAIAENLHRAELTKLERDDQVARWINLMEQKAGREEVSSQLAKNPQVGRPQGGINAAAREIGVDKDDAYRAIKVASLSPEAKAAARQSGLDDNRSALLAAAKQFTPAAQVQSIQRHAERGHGCIANRYQSNGSPTPAGSAPVDYDALETRFTAGGEWFLKADLSGMLKFLEGKGPRRAQALRLMSSLAEHLDAVREGASR